MSWTSVGDQVVLHHLVDAVRWRGCRDHERDIGLGVLAAWRRRGAVPSEKQWAVVRPLVERWREAMLVSADEGDAARDAADAQGELGL